MSNKGVMQFTPSAEDLSPVQGPQKTAESYGDRMKRRSDVEQIKGKGGPLGGTPPIPEGKLEQLLPVPSFDHEPQSTVPGIGSAYAVNQAMARGEVTGPISMAEAKKMGLAGSVSKESPLSTETVQALQVTKETMEKDTRLEDAEREIVDEGKKDTSLTNAFDFDSILRAQHPLMSEDRRKAIEKKLGKLSLDDMIVNREIQQVIPIVPGKFELTLRTFSQREYVWILGFLYEHPGSPVHNEQLLNTFKLVLSVVAINGRMLPDHRKNLGTSKEDVDRELFEKKMFHIASFPVQMVADMGIQCNWFNNRINDLLTYENVKNG